MREQTTETYKSTPIIEECFETVVGQYIPELHRAAIGLVRNKMDAEDLVQETLLRAFRFWDRFIPGSNCRAWLHRILQNQHINQWRSRSRRPKLIDIDSIEENTLFHHSLLDRRDRTPEQEFLNKHLDDDLVTAVRGLQHKFRAIVILYHMHDLSYQQIAGQVKLNVGTVKSRLYRGRRLLQAKLSEYGKRNRYVARYN